MDGIHLILPQKAFLPQAVEWMIIGIVEIAELRVTRNQDKNIRRQQSY